MQNAPNPQTLISNQKYSLHIKLSYIYFNYIAFKNFKEKINLYPIRQWSGDFWKGKLFN
jgi:hypothetical protein